MTQAQADWPYTRYDEDEVEIEVEYLTWDEAGAPESARITYRDLTKKIPCQDLEDFANNEVSLEDWDVQSSGWDEDRKVFVIEALL